MKMTPDMTKVLNVINISSNFISIMTTQILRDKRFEHGDGDIDMVIAVVADYCCLLLLKAII